jgi:undecaprenyl-diphosphatase
LELIQAIVRGIVQGITEFLPISSSAHLILIPWFLGWEDLGLAFDAALHFGTLVSLVLFFRTEWIHLARAALRVAVSGRAENPDQRMAVYILLATLPGGVAGLLGGDFVESQLRSPVVPGVTLILLGLVLLLAERTGSREKTFERITLADALVIGFAQALALVPGVSRSGVTITAALFRGVRREPAARFSFLLSTPIIAGAAGTKLLDLLGGSTDPARLGMLGVGVGTSAIVGYLAIRFMLRYLATNTTYIFVSYRVLLGIVVLLAFWWGFR